MKYGKVLVIYHAKCLDGFSAAAIMKHWLMAEGHASEEITLHPGVYGEPPPEIDGDTAVAVLDFSYPMKIMSELAHKAFSFLWIDHHQSAIDAYDNAPGSIDLPNGKSAVVVLGRDNTKSGALLTWDYLWEGQPAPAVVRAVSDRDVWAFKLAHTREITAYAFTIPHDYDLFIQMLHAFGTYLEQIKEAGKALSRKHLMDCTSIVDDATVIDRVAFLNCNHVFASECGSMLAKRDDVDFVACYIIVGQYVRFSLRSDGKFDVSAVAKRHGGGGHKAAAGCTINLGANTLGETLHSLTN